MKAFACSSLRVRLLLLVLASIIPAIAMTLYTNREHRKTAAAAAHERATRLVRLAAAN